MKRLILLASMLMAILTIQAHRFNHSYNTSNLIAPGETGMSTCEVLLPVVDLRSCTADGNTSTFIITQHPVFFTTINSPLENTLLNLDINSQVDVGLVYFVEPKLVTNVYCCTLYEELNLVANTYC